MDESLETTVEALAARLRTTDPFVLLDVREAWELERARIDDSRLLRVPMSVLGQLGLRALPPAAASRDAEILVLCHHGTRSAQVASWLQSHGWRRALSVAGGMDEYARKIDAAVGIY
jgi:rhodanese-related sulfurtransferase